MEDQLIFPDKFKQKKIEKLSFEEGLAESLRRIKKILENKNIAVVAFCVMGANVGKSTLAKRITEALQNDQIYTHTVHAPKDLTREELESARKHVSARSFRKIVFIFDQCDYYGVFLEEFKLHYNQYVEKALRGTKYSAKKINLWIGISTPEQPFLSEVSSVDILIENELAKEK